MVSILPIKQTRIKFSPNEVEYIGNLIQNYKGSPKPEIRTRIFDMFIPKMLEKAEVLAKMANGNEVCYFNDLYQAFWRQFDAIIMQEKKYIVYQLCKLFNQTLPLDFIPNTYSKRTSQESYKEQALIKVSHQESVCIGRLITDYKNNPTEDKKFEVFNIFLPKIKSRAGIIAWKTNISAVDYLHDLYLAFWDQFDNILSENKNFVYEMCKVLNNTNPADFIPVTYSRRTVDELTRDEFNSSSYVIDAQSLSQKKEKFMAVVESTVKRKNLYIIKYYLGGLINAEAEKDVPDKMRGRTEKTFEIFAGRLKQPDMKAMLKKIYCEETSDGDVLLSELSGDMIPKSTKPKKEEHNTELIREAVQSNRDHLDIFAELKGIMAVQTKYENLFTNKTVTGMVRKKIEENPEFKFIIKLPDKCNNKKFKDTVARKSIKVFGKNIFKFVY